MIQEQIQPRTKRKRITTIDRREKLSHKELIKEYVEPGLPVIITDAVKNWDALDKISPQFFKETYGHYTKEIKGVTYTYAEFMDLMVAANADNPCPYPCNLNIETIFPELMKDVRPEVVYGKIDRVNHPLLPKFMFRETDRYEFFLGGAGSAFPFLHIDALFLHNQATQLYGTKDFIMYPPEDAIYFYPTKENPKHCPINVLNPDYDKYPLFKEAQPVRITLKKGETLLFPSGWWHYTQMYGPSISMGRVHLNHKNWDLYVADESRIWKERSKIVGNMVYIYGKALGKIMDLQEKFV